MAEIVPAQLALAVLSLLLLTVLGAMFVCWGWMLFRLATGQRLLPSQPLVSLRSPPWRGGTVLLAFVTYIVVNSAVVSIYLRAQGRAPRKPAETSKPADQSKSKADVATSDSQRTLKREDTGTAKALRPGNNAAQPEEKQAREPAAASVALARSESEKDDGPLSLVEQMALVSVINCMLLVILPILLRATSGARLHDLGLSFERWDVQAAVGVVATMIATAAVYSIQLAAIRVWKPNPHALQKMLLKDFDSWGVADLAVISAVILAPMIEEMMFRGLLQRWCIDALVRRATPHQRKPDSPSVLDDPAALASDVLVEPKETAAPTGLPSLRRAAVPLGITVTSLAFAVVHYDQWPAPIPLFVLALIIGTVYHRTGSLIAAVMMHATFNGFSTLAMFAAILAGNEKGAAEAVEGLWNVPAVVKELKRGVCGTAPLQTVGKFPNSNRLLLDERISDC